MPLDPSTLCARTTAGDAELAAPRHGLAIAQRRLLTLLDQPLALDELAARPGLQPDRLERDLARLAEHGLVEIHRPAGATGPMFPPRRMPTAAVVIPPPPTPTVSPALPPARREAAPPTPIRRIRRGRALLIGFASLAAVGAAIWLFASPAPEPVRPTRPASAPSGSAASGTVRTASAASAETASRNLEPVRAVIAVPAAPERTAAVPATPMRDRPARAADAAPLANVPPRASDAVPQASQPVRAVPSNAAPAIADLAPSPIVIAPSPPIVPLDAPAPAPAVTPPAIQAAAAATPPVQVATATPTTLDARAASRAPAALSREAPEFPREAVVAGVREGVVRARLSIDAAGRVTGVDVLDAQPRRVFDRAVTRTLARWTFEPGAAGRSTDVEVAFHRE